MLELVSAFLQVIMVMGLVVGGKTGILVRGVLEFGKKYQPLGIIFLIILVCWFFLVGAVFIWPLAIRIMDTQLRAPEGNISLKYIYAIAARSFGPWLDVLTTSLKQGYSDIIIDRVAVMYLGIGAFAMFLTGIKAAVSGESPSPKAAVVISLLAIATFAVYYLGLWIVGGMGDLFGILIWHGVMLYTGLSVFQEWIWLVRDQRAQYDS